MNEELKLFVVKIERPVNDMSVNIILGMSHFIKTVEDLHEALVNAVPSIKFGLAFMEASGPKMIRHSGTDKEMENLAVLNMKKLMTGHSFIIFLKDSYPVNVLNSIKNVNEVCRVFCATANEVSVIVAENIQGRGIMGVVDGQGSDVVETAEDMVERKKFLRTIGYKA